MLEENEGRQSGLSQIGGVSGANAQRFNFKSFWLRERIFFHTKTFGMSYFSFSIR